MKKIWLLKVCLLFVLVSKAQTPRAIALPIRFHGYMQTYHRINPAIVNHDFKMSAFAGIQANSIMLGNVYTTYADIYYAFSKENALVSQAAGFQFTGDNEGELLNRSRAYLSYAIEISLSEKYRLGAGFTFGFASFSIKSTPVSGGGGSMVPDANVGLVLKGRESHLGLSIAQVLPNELRPIEEATQLVTHYNIIGDREYDLSPYVSVKPGFWLRWYNKEVHDLGLNALADIKDLILLGTEFNYNKNMAFMAGLKNIQIAGGAFSFCFYYGQTIGKDNLSGLQTYEWTLRYLMKKKKK